MFTRVLAVSSFSAKRFRSNSSYWHGTPMSSGGVRNVYTSPVVRSNSKVVVWKYSLSGGQLNSILPLVVSIGSLSLIRSPTQVSLMFGTYQSRPIVPCLLTNSLMTSSSVLCRFTVEFMAGSGVSEFCYPLPCSCYWVFVLYLLWVVTQLSLSSMHCASVMALV